MRPDATDLLIQSMREELERIRSLSPEEARRDARENLHRIGLVDEHGNITERYQGAFVRV